MPKLEYRSLVFEEEWVPEPEDEFFQEAMVRSLGLGLGLGLGFFEPRCAHHNPATCNMQQPRNPAALLPATLPMPICRRIMLATCRPRLPLP